MEKRGEIIVAMDLDMPGFFSFNGEYYGYQYDLLKAYADHLEKPLRVVSDGGNYNEMLLDGDVDIVATLSSHVAKKSLSTQVIPIYNTSYVILARRGSEAVSMQRSSNPIAKMSGSDLLISSSFKDTKVYSDFIDSLDGVRITSSTESSFDLIDKVSRGEYDYMICEKSEAQIGTALIKNVTTVYHFDQQIGVSLVVSPKCEGLKENFNTWLTNYRNGSEYAVLNDLYFEKGIVGQLMGANLKNQKGRISPFDEIIRKVSIQEGFDWRFLSAIAYQESKFNTSVVSHRGARGLMQIMPSVAQQFKVNETRMMEPEVNVYLAAKLLRLLERKIIIPASVSQEERMKIILAAYNSGIGHVLDARRLAVKYGEDPHSWSTVAKYLMLKELDEYSKDEVVTSGRFTGIDETAAFVDKVMSKYNSYCNRVRL